MPDLIVMPDVLRATRDFLFDNLDGVPVVTRLPDTKTWPIVRLTQFGDRPVTQRPLWFVSTSIQVEVLGLNLSSTTVRAIAAQAYALLASEFTGSDDLVVSACNPSGLRDEPDTSFDPACARWLFVVEVFARPIPSSPPPESGYSDTYTDVYA